MRDDAVLRRALPLGRGLGRLHTGINYYNTAYRPTNIQYDINSRKQALQTYNLNVNH